MMEKNPLLGTYAYNEYATGAKRYGPGASAGPNGGLVSPDGYRNRDLAQATRSRNMMGNARGRMTGPWEGLRGGVAPQPQIPQMSNKPVPPGGKPGIPKMPGRPSRPNDMVHHMGQSGVAQQPWMENMPTQNAPVQGKQPQGNANPMLRRQIYANWLKDNSVGAYGANDALRMGHY